MSVDENKDEDEGTLDLDSVFTEPPRPPSPEPTIVTYTREKESTSSTAHDWSKLDLQLVGFHPLWGQHLWNAAIAFASYLDRNEGVYVDKNVLELGAGGGLPGIVASLNGARRVVLTDYPDKPLLDNLSHNIEKNVPEPLRSRVSVQGYIWGKSVDPLLPSPSGENEDVHFDLIIMSDLIFNHSQHGALLDTCDLALKRANDNELPSVLVFFTHHRPHLLDRDMIFFDLARQRGWVCQEVLTQKFKPMFPEDIGDVEIRSTVHGWRLTRGPATT
ncbi:nicotinamide N-methyltransferase [Schizopora paradoxa]|uniref:Protein N-terminal and lysine N-methyltransferase EFM7 n=1 Tax=Schizopora paradoxa TaxID=27342 RepID=A0A0H2S4B1_9AGAM|nr:nicotinamide N-methyltransferase [Schizopora paradoxa]